MKKFLALLFALVVTVAGAQQVQTTNNLITSGTTHTWSGVQTGTVPANYMPGGPTPKYDPATNTIYFSYNASAYVGQVIQINQALANAGAGVKVTGYNYSYEVRNMNGDDRQGGIDTFTVATALRGPNNSTLLSSNQYFNTKFDWTSYSGTKTATTPYNISDLTYLQVGITGGDNGNWAGYFGPQVRNVNLSLKYYIDPCVTNPAYSTTCANYNTVSTSNNLLSGTTGAQAYAINTALAQAGANTTIHGFDYGYTYNVAGRTCAIWNLFGVCLSGWDYSDAGVDTSLTNSSGTTIYTENNTHNGGDNGVSGNYAKAYRLSSSVPMSTLGTFSMNPWTSGDASITGMYSRAVYTPDPCTANPLSSTSCPGYAQAYHDQQCTVNPLYAVDCPGYQAAYFTQQCTSNPLYNSACPGYATAYYNQQCSISALYDSGCPGYATAYKNQQCSLSALYATDCPGYDAAYKTQQCSLNALYATDCPGYAQAYHDQQCSLNTLYATDCPGYAQAYHDQQCSSNPLYMSDCIGYAVAYKNQQCGISALYATDCPGYAGAYKAQQCSLNSLYATDCPGYAVAYKSQQCTANPLYATDCPGYAQAYFNQQCNLNGLYDRSCPNYSSAYAKTQLLNQQPTTTTTTTLSTQTDPAVQTATTAASTGITDPTVSTAVASTTNSSTTSQTSPTSVTSSVSVLAPPPAAAAATQSAISSVSVTPAPTQAQQQERQADAKKTDSAVSSVERKAGGNKAEAAKAAAAAAKDAAEKSANATSMEAQAANQGLVVGLMGYVPGFSAYQNAIVPDVLSNAVARQYMKPPVDNRNAQRRLSGANESRWQEMVDSQYKLGN